MTTEGSENIIESEEERVQSDLSGEETADQAIRGLTLQEVEDRKARGLINEEVSSSTRTVREIVKENVLTYFNLIFAVLAVLLIAVGQFKDLTFLLIVAANTGIGIAQEIRSKQILDNLKFEKMSTLSGMFNVCYDYAMTDAWSLYAGLGLGVARVNYTVTEGTNSGAKLIAVRAAGGGDYNAAAGKPLVLKALPNFVTNLHKTEYSKTVFAWQLMAGVGYEFNENWKLTLGYKLFNTAKVKQTFAGKEYKIKMPFNHTAELGLTYTF